MKFQTHIHRKLLGRLAAVATGAGIVLAAIVYAQMHDDVGAVVLDRAEQGIAHFGTYADDLIGADTGPPDPAALQSRLETFIARGLRKPLGHFVAVRLLGPAGNPLARVADRGFAGIATAEAYLDRSGGRLSKDVEHGREVLELDGRPCVHVVLPLRNNRGEAVLDVVALFAVSDRAIGEVRFRMARAVGLGLLIILVTAALLNKGDRHRYAVTRPPMADSDRTKALILRRPGRGRCGSGWKVLMATPGFPSGHYCFRASSSGR